MTPATGAAVVLLGSAAIWRAAGTAIQPLGLPVWVEYLAAPTITGLFALAGLFARDWVRLRQHRDNLDERELLIQQLLHDIEDARHGEASARKDLDAVCKQRDRLQRELDRLRPPA